MTKDEVTICLSGFNEPLGLPRWRRYSLVKQPAAALR